MARARISKNEYLKRVSNKHGEGCYELIGEFVDMSTKITMKHRCGHEMTTTPSVFLKDKEYCRDCSNKRLSEKYSTPIEDLKPIIESYKYNLISEDYPEGSERNSVKYLNFECPHGHRFPMTWNAFQMGKRCPDCKFIKKSEQQRLPIDEVHRKINDLNYTLIEFPSGYKNRNSQVTVECENNHITTKSLASILIGNGCPDCIKPSKPEREIREYLVENEIKFESQYKFDDCINTRKLPFDFAILDENNNVKFLIEYDGEQHFKPNSKFGGEEGFRRTVENDKIKNDYCQSNDITLIRISYKDKKKIKKILSEIFFRQM